MSTREYAVNLINTLSDEQVEDIIIILKSYSVGQNRTENNDDEWGNKLCSFERIKQIRNTEWNDSGKDYKEMYLEYLDERYGI